MAVNPSLKLEAPKVEFTTILTPRTEGRGPSPDTELGHWVTGSIGHLGHLSRTGHWVIILIRVFRFSKKIQLRDKYSLAWDDANLAFWRRI